MHTPRHAALVAIFVLFAAAPAAQTRSESRWTFDTSLYCLGAGMTGDVTVHGVAADLDVGFDDILRNLEFGAMGKVRVGHDRWGLSVDSIYMQLEAAKNGVSASMDEWVVEPTISYQLTDVLEALVGVRYNSLDGELRGPGVLPSPRIAASTEAWWDPIVGAHLSLPLGSAFRAHVRADVGGFGVASDLTWQLFPYVDWRCADWFSLQAGYRFYYVDYEDGAGSDRFEWDVLTQGWQLGFTVHF